MHVTEEARRGHQFPVTDGYNPQDVGEGNQSPAGRAGEPALQHLLNTV